MASQKRFELPTHGLEGRCSIRLSYWDIQNYYIIIHLFVSFVKLFEFLMIKVVKFYLIKAFTLPKI